MNCFIGIDKKDYANTASLKALMSTPPMTREQHAALMQKRKEQRRMVEEAQDLRAEAQRNPW